MFSLIEYRIYLTAKDCVSFWIHNTICLYLFVCNGTCFMMITCININSHNSHNNRHKHTHTYTFQSNHYTKNLRNICKLQRIIHWTRIMNCNPMSFHWIIHCLANPVDKIKTWELEFCDVICISHSNSCSFDACGMIGKSTKRFSKSVLDLGFEKAKNDRTILASALEITILFLNHYILV